MISSVGKNRELGRKNELIWHIPKDMKFFKNTTMGHVVVMGKNTYESLPGDLPGRKMVVLSFDKIVGNVETVYSVEEILNKYLDIDEKENVVDKEDKKIKSDIGDFEITDEIVELFGYGYSKSEYKKIQNCRLLNTEMLLLRYVNVG